MSSQPNTNVISGGIRLGPGPALPPSPAGKRKRAELTNDKEKEVPLTESIAPRTAPLLLLPLPSKRYKKQPGPKALLIPLELLPVYALPPLPPIRDPHLAQQVFNHISLFEKSSTKFEDPVDRPSQHYEKLEHVGDSILGMVVTTWLHEIMPRLTCGTATKLKAHLVSNATLSHLSGLYCLPQRLQGDPNLLPVLRAQTDVRAAMMEAYIAALYFSFPVDQRFGEGLKVIDKWLRAMYEPMLEFFYKYMKKEYEDHHLTLPSALTGAPQLYTEEEIKRIDTASQGMANLLQMYCYRQGQTVHYAEERLETHVGILWRLKCEVDGEVVGEATRSGRRVAKNVAAWEGCKLLGLVSEQDAGGGKELAPITAEITVNGKEDDKAMNAPDGEVDSREDKGETPQRTAGGEDKHA